MSREDERHFGTADLARSAEDPHAQDLGTGTGSSLHDPRRVAGDETMSRAGADAGTPLHDPKRALDDDAMNRREAGMSGTAGMTGMSGTTGMPGTTGTAGLAGTTGAEPLAALFQGPMADEFRHRWDAIQIGFVDDPRAAVRNADELVAQVLRALAESFADQRSQIESGLGEGEHGNTENMRIALQRYRSFFQRLLSL